MVKYLEAHGVKFQYDTEVTNVIFDIKNGKKLAKEIVYKHKDKEETIELTKNDGWQKNY